MAECSIVSLQMEQSQLVQISECPAAKCRRITEDKQSTPHQVANLKDCRIPRLVKALASRRNAAIALDELLPIARRENQRTYIVAAGAVESLVALLRFGAIKAQGRAARMLSYLAESDEDLMPLVMKAGAIRTIQDLLAGRDAEAKVHGMELLYTLAKLPAACELSMGIVHLLMLTLGIDEAGAQVAAVKTISRLANVSCCRGAIIEAGAVAKIEKICTETWSDDAKPWIAEALKALGVAASRTI